MKVLDQITDPAGAIVNGMPGETEPHVVIPGEGVFYADPELAEERGWREDGVPRMYILPAVVDGKTYFKVGHESHYARGPLDLIPHASDYVE